MAKSPGEFDHDGMRRESLLGTKPAAGTELQGRKEAAHPLVGSRIPTQAFSHPFPLSRCNAVATEHPGNQFALHPARAGSHLPSLGPMAAP